MAYTEDGTCWLVGDYVLLFYVPLFAYVGWSIFTVIFTVFMAIQHEFTEAAMNVLLPKLAFTILFVATWTLGAIHRMMHLDVLSTENLAIIFSSSFFLGANGFCNFMLCIPILHQQKMVIRKKSVLNKALELVNRKDSSGLC